MVEGRRSIPVYVFGSDGGGGRFALGLEDGAVYYLPSSGEVRDGVFRETNAAVVRRLAPDVIGCLERLLSDIEAFTRGVEGHVFLDRAKD